MPRSIAAEIAEMERLVNHQILRNTPVTTHVMPIDQAISTGAMALFGEKYGEEVRVVSIPDFSKELCGGTHVTRTGDIGVFKIIYGEQYLRRRSPHRSHHRRRRGQQYQERRPASPHRGTAAASPSRNWWSR